MAKSGVRDICVLGKRLAAQKMNKKRRLPPSLGFRSPAFPPF